MVRTVRDRLGRSRLGLQMSENIIIINSIKSLFGPPAGP